MRAFLPAELLNLPRIVPYALVRRMATCERLSQRVQNRPVKSVAYLSGNFVLFASVVVGVDLSQGEPHPDLAVTKGPIRYANFGFVSH